MVSKIEDITDVAKNLSDLCMASGVGFGIFLLEETQECISAMTNLSLEERAHIIEVLTENLSTKEINYLLAIMTLQRDRRVASCN